MPGRRHTKYTCGSVRYAEYVEYSILSAIHGYMQVAPSTMQGDR